MDDSLPVLNNDYKVDLDVFEGPLDLLLYLIRKDEIDIYDISIERITKQYMEYLDMMKMLDLNIAGEFLVMASSLMLIKSRMLLPVETRTNDGEDDEDEQDPRLDLVRQLVEYKKFKDASFRLMGLEYREADCYLNSGEVVFDGEDGDEDAPRLADIGLFDLLSAFKDALARTPTMPLDHLKAIIWSVPEKMSLIEESLRSRGRFNFSMLFTDKTPRGEVIVSFLALLELLKQHRISVTQTSAFDEIQICEYGGVPVVEASVDELEEDVADDEEDVADDEDEEDLEEDEEDE